jgi:hypothetical protein
MEFWEQVIRNARLEWFESHKGDNWILYDPILKNGPFPDWCKLYVALNRPWYYNKPRCPCRNCY